jgi:hypothetical protein
MTAALKDLIMLSAPLSASSNLFLGEYGLIGSKN